MRRRAVEGEDLRVGCLFANLRVHAAERTGTKSAETNRCSGGYPVVVVTFPFEIGGPAFRARQVRAWVFQRYARTFGEMTDLPLGERQELIKRYPQIRPEPAAVWEADGGETRKALFDGSYETVAMRYPDRRT